jgi:hypothetical protein
VEPIRSGWLRTYTKVVSAAVTGLVLLGCAGSEEATLEVAAEETGTEGAGGEDGAGEGDVTDAPEDRVEGTSDLRSTEASDDGGDTAEGPEHDDAWPDPIALDASGRTGAGFVIELFELRADGSTIDVEVRVTNGQQTEARLNARMANDPTALVDDLDNEYPLVPPEDDPGLTIAAGEIVEGSLAFVGPLAPDATAVSLVVNPGPFAGVREGSNGSEAPLVRIEDVPLGTGEHADDGG